MIQDEMHQALADCWQAQGWMLTKAIVIAEQINDDGERSLIVVPSPEMRTWEIAGFLWEADQQNREVPHE